MKWNAHTVLSLLHKYTANGGTSVTVCTQSSSQIKPLVTNLQLYNCTHKNNGINTFMYTGIAVT